MDLEFDFDLHGDPSSLEGTQYFEFLPGRYLGTCWNLGSRFLHEYTFCLIEGIFEAHAQGYDHFNFAEVSREEWIWILRSLVALREELAACQPNQVVVLPYGSTLSVRSSFERDFNSNRPALIGLLGELEPWLAQSLVEHDVISVLGL